MEERMSAMIAVIVRIADRMTGKINNWERALAQASDF
jgi:hypothetical protein